MGWLLSSYLLLRRFLSFQAPIDLDRTVSLPLRVRNFEKAILYSHWSLQLICLIVLSGIRRGFLHLSRFLRCIRRLFHKDHNRCFSLHTYAVSDSISKERHA